MRVQTKAPIRKLFKVGDTFTINPESEQYGKHIGPKYRVAAVFTHYVPSDRMASDPTGHPGFDPGSGSALYEADGLNFALYDWEMIPA